MSTTDSPDPQPLAERTLRALRGPMAVINDDLTMGLNEMWVVNSGPGRNYRVDLREGACECHDHQYRGSECKHLRRVQLALGRRAIPEWVDPGGLDATLLAERERLAEKEGDT